MGDLADWAKENSPFIKLADGESVTGIYNGFNKSSYMGKPLIEYQIDKKVLSSGSGKLASLMDKVSKGTEITITRHGNGTETTYTVKRSGEDEAIAWDEDE